MRRLQKKRALTKTQKANREELRKQILGMLEYGKVRLEVIGLPGETSLLINKFRSNRRDYVVYKHKDQL